jgi:hypothetical protein
MRMHHDESCCVPRGRRGQKADVRRERVPNADVYVIQPFGSPLPLQSLHFPGFAACRAGILDGAME